MAAAAAAAAAKYVKMEPIDHVLLRPDTYVGPLSSRTETLYVLDEAGGGRLVERAVSYPPALLNIIGEVLLNAADHGQRGATRIDVTLDAAAGSVRVRNDGPGIPLGMHPTHKIHVPELIMGHMLTSSNYNDDEKRTVGGRNGLGAKLANIYATHFEIEMQTGAQRYTQRFSKNMKQHEAPVLRAAKTRDGKVVGGDYVCITMWPEFARFGAAGPPGAGGKEGKDVPERAFSADMVALVGRRVVDIAACNAALRVSFNGRRVAMHSLAHYAEACLGARAVFEGKKRAADGAAGADADAGTGDGADGAADAGAGARRIVSERCGARWEVGVALAADDATSQVSFVNSIATTKGGTHVKHVLDVLVKQLAPLIEKAAGKKGPAVKPAQIRAQLCVFVNCLIENPTFASQCKEEMTSRVADFGSRCEVSEAFAKRIAKQLALADAVLRYASYAHEKQIAAASATGKGAKRRRITGLPKLDDANLAGGPRSAECTLFLVEGDSAKALAVAGLAVVGRDAYGVFPLRGKLLNVREATAAQERTNAEIIAVTRILGLEHKRVYTAADIAAGALRYGHVALMCDQDHDGSHIKGLVINFLHHYWPSLLRVPGFLRVFITPIVRCTRPRASLRETREFFTLQQYEAWRATPEGAAAAWKSQYMKGLGTSTAADARAYFGALAKHMRTYTYGGAADDAAITLAFAKTHVNERKEWLSAVAPDTFLDFGAPTHTFSEFVHRELVLFSLADCARSIPALADGLKPGQRKILFACFKRRLTADIKVAQLAGYVSEHAAYHHGEESLMKTIIKMAQTFVGANNINLLVPSGQFGTRLAGGKDAASARYIYTRLEGVTRILFSPDDDALLDAQDDDGTPIEPRCYVPVLPLVLVNGAEGIGTGWASSIPQHAPRHVVARLRALIGGTPLAEIAPLQPCYRGFRGTITRDNAPAEGAAAAPAHYAVRGVATYDAASGVVEVRELPLGVWTSVYKETVMEAYVAGAPDATPPRPPLVASFAEQHTESAVHFIARLTAAGVAAVARSGVGAVFKLVDSISTSNMVLFDGAGKIRRYATTHEILGDFYTLRRALYVRRRTHCIARLRADATRHASIVNFVAAVAAHTIVVARPAAAVLADLAAGVGNGGAPYARLPRARAAVAVDAAVDAADAAAGADADAIVDDSADARDYAYLMEMPISALTTARATLQRAKLEATRAALAAMEAATPETLWLADLDAFEAQVAADAAARAGALAAETAAARPSPAKRSRVAA